MRYDDDDVHPVDRYASASQVTTFSICTFWLAQALAMIGDRKRADRVFRRKRRAPRTWRGAGPAADVRN